MPSSASDKEYLPSVLVTAVWASLVAWLVAVTVAPGTAAPLASRATPLSRPWDCTPADGLDEKNATSETVATMGRSRTRRRGRPDVVSGFRQA
jgi:hypothetical protein